MYYTKQQIPQQHGAVDLSAGHGRTSKLDWPYLWVTSAEAIWPFVKISDHLLFKYYYFFQEMYMYADPTKQGCYITVWHIVVICVRCGLVIKLLIGLY